MLKLWAITLMLAAVMASGPVVSEASEMSIRAEGHGVAISTWRPETSISLIASVGAVIADVTCPFGIDRGVVRRLEAKWPEQLVLRLRLQGLEGFNAGNGKFDIKLSVSNSTERTTRVSLQREGGTVRLAKESPYWTDVDIIYAGQAGASEIDYFDIALPTKFFEDNPEEIKVHWVNFYRM